jgi:GH35 family endo-1,4-beta-xylanase
MKKINKKEKASKTLAKMKKTRKEDTLFLRVTLENKLKWATTERQKGLDTIKRFEDNIKIVRDSILKLNGAIVTITDVLDSKKEEQE